MDLTEAQIEEFGIALNEASLLGAEVDPERRMAGVTLAVLALPEGAGPARSDSRVQLMLLGVERVVASLRAGNWDDSSAEVIQFPLDALLEVVTGFNGQPIYGWEFLDVPDEKDFASWSSRLSLDWVGESRGAPHTLTLFQEGTAAERHLDLRFWFESMRIFRPDGEQLALDDFTAAGRRWWDGLHAGDPRTAGHGIHPGPFGGSDQ